MLTKTTQLGSKGVVVIPADFRTRLNLEVGSLLLLEEFEGGILIRPAKAVPVRVYSDRDRAKFLLEDAVDLPGYQAARRRVAEMGLDPDSIPHERPDRAP